MGSSSSKNQSKTPKRLESGKEALESFNVSSSSGDSRTIRQEFPEKNICRQPRSIDDIKKEAYANTVRSKDRIWSKTLNRQSETGVLTSVKPVDSGGLKRPQNGSSNSSSIYPSLSKESSFDSSWTPQVENFSYDTRRYNVKSNVDNSHSVVPRNQLNSNSSRLHLETGGINMKAETSFNSSRSSQVNNSFFSVSDNLSNIRTSDTKNSPVFLNNLSDSLKNNLSITENATESKTVNENVDILKHEAFLKRLVASHDFHSSRRNRGFYCNVCHLYKIYYGKLSNSSDSIKHDQTEVHKKAIVDKNDIKRYYCPQCKAHFFGDVKFWKDHLDMDLHKIFADKRNSRQISNYDENLESFSRNKKKNVADKPLHTIPSMSLFDYLSLQKGNDRCFISSDLILKRGIAENFYKKLTNDDKGNYSFYCHACEMWTDSNDVWKNHNEIHEKDLKFKNTLKNCTFCRVIIVGDDKLKQFHCNDEEHESLKMLLAGEINKDKSFNDNDSSDNDDSENDDEDNARRNDKKLSALLIKGLMNGTNRNDVFHSMKQYGNVDKIFMHFVGPTSAKVIFKFRSTARNLVNNGVPISIKGSKVEISLTEL